MNTYFKSLKRLDQEAVAQLGIVAIFIGLLFSYAVLSIATVLLLANTLFRYKPVNLLKIMWERKEFLTSIVIFSITIISFIWSENGEYMLHKARVKLPLLAFPFAFAPLNFSKKQFRELIIIFTFLMTLVCIGTLGNYILFMEEIHQLYLQGKVMPAPMNHVRFSMLVVLAVFCGVYLFNYFKIEQDKLMLRLCTIATIVLIIFLHIYAVRSGLFALYIVLFVLGLREILKASNPIAASRYMLAGLAFLILCFSTVPTLKNRFSYLKYDIGSYFTGNSSVQSTDSGRMISINYGWRLFLQNPIIGIGGGDIIDEVAKIYAEEFPEITGHKRLVPHNQYLYFLAISGLLGFMVFSLAFFWPLAIPEFRNNMLFLAFFTLIAFSFMSEATLEVQNGISIYCVFLFLFFTQLRREEIIKQELTQSRRVF